MNGHRQLTERLEALVDRDNQPDWEDVVRRAGAPSGTAGSPRGRSRRSYLVRRLVPALALAAVVIAVGLIAPWNHGPSLTERALAAIGNGPVTHVVLSQKTSFSYINLKTERQRPQLMTTEIWFDSKRHSVHEKLRLEGRLMFDQVQTPAGLSTWIGRQRYGSSQPKLDPALAGFADGYRSALESGLARVRDEGTVNGREVTWIEIPRTKMETERIAVDKKSSLPVRIVFYNRVEGLNGGYDVRLIETLRAGEGDFTPKPAIGPPITGLLRSTGIPVTVLEASKAIPGALWNGKRVSGLSLSRVVQVTLTTEYSKKSGRAPRSAAGIALKYGQGTPRSLGGSSGKPFIRLEETAERPPTYYWVSFGGALPATGSLLARCSDSAPRPPAHNECDGFMVSNNLYVRIQASSRKLLLAAARGLEPIRAPGGRD